MKREFKVEANVGAPQVAYRETITKNAEIDYTHKKQSGGTGQFARVKLVFEPQQPGFGYAFENKITGGSVPKEYIPGVEKGLNSVLGAGVLAGFPVVDLKVSLTDGAFHEVDSSAIAFEIAARAALREGLQKAGSVLLGLGKKADFNAKSARSAGARLVRGLERMKCAKVRLAFAGAFGAKLTPVDAYKFARGEEVTASSGQPVKLSRTPAKLAAATPERGQHTTEVLRELGYSDTKIDELKKKGIL